MERRNIGGPDGLSVSLVGLGCNAFGGRVDEKGTHAVLDAAIDAGIDFFDTAESYGATKSESFMGTWLKANPGKAIVASKFGINHSNVAGKPPGSAENVKVSCDLSLKRLQVDCIDLYQLHRPDPQTPVGETMGALEDLAKEGKIRLYGCSGFSGAQMQEAVDSAKGAGQRGFVTAQNPWNMILRDIEQDLVPVCEANGITILPYYPIAKGLLTGKYRRDATAPAGSRLEGMSDLDTADYDLLERLEAYAKDNGYDLLTLAMSWLAAQQVICSIITGGSKPEQMASNADAVRWTLTAANLAAIDAILAG